MISHEEWYVQWNRIEAKQKWHDRTQHTHFNDRSLVVLNLNERAIERDDNKIHTYLICSVLARRRWKREEKRESERKRIFIASLVLWFFFFSSYLFHLTEDEDEE